MLTTAQIRHLQELHDTLATRPDIGPVEPPRVGADHFCGGHRPRWLYDITTLELATEIARRTDHRCRCRCRILGIPLGRPKLDPLRDHYGLSEHQIRTMQEIDLLPIPDTRHDGRNIWRQRQQDYIQLTIRAGAPAPPAGRTTKDNLVVLTAIALDRQPEPNATPQPVASNVS